MASIQESRFLDLVPVRLTHIASAVEAMKPRLVRIYKDGVNEIWVNPATVSVVNAHGDDVHIGVEGHSFSSSFKTAEEAVKALGMATDDNLS